MNIQKIHINQINPAAYNPRIDLKPGDPDYEKLKKSIDTFGYVEPLVWNSRTGNLVGGHQRLKILLEQGVKEVEVSVVDLDSEKEKALNLALNRIRGDWDKEKLGALLDELSKSPDFDVILTGFDIPEISGILDQLEEAKEDSFDFEGEVNKIKNPKTKPGDIIELGEHRILCGDASKLEDLAKLLMNEKVGLIHTDPPYNVDYYGGARPNEQSRPATHKLWDRIYSDNLPQDEYEKWLKTILSNAAAYLLPGAAVYIWNGHKQFGPMYLMLAELNFHISCVITWAKPTFALGYGDYQQQTEFCLYGWKEKGGSHKWYGPNNESTLWQIKRDNTADYIHPTQKPVAIAHRAIRNSSKRGDIVLDLFLGSGTTLIAAESLKRRCFGTEIDPAYCDGIVKRYVKCAGKEKVSPEVLAKYEIY
ncbi:MAG: DNA modification methylase [Candidatus Omnitrophica bacterium]|nr:DNA modification methylase [Candidatus Omnitrophota bacterium]